MFNIVIMIISVLIPIGLIVLYYLLNRSLENQANDTDKTNEKDDTKN
ncbi:MAG: hypothetical protein IJ740_11950 [Ruminococcus sp.]|nr:hypothetical protein [Ruminococcus sp.]